MLVIAWAPLQHLSVPVDPFPHNSNGSNLLASRQTYVRHKIKLILYHAIQCCCLAKIMRVSSKRKSNSQTDECMFPSHLSSKAAIFFTLEKEKSIFLLIYFLWEGLLQKLNFNCSQLIQPSWAYELKYILLTNTSFSRMTHYPPLGLTFKLACFLFSHVLFAKKSSFCTKKVFTNKVQKVSEEHQWSFS